MIRGRKTATPDSSRREALFQTSRTTQEGGASKVWNGPAKTYYDLPLVKKAHWSWQIVLYFFLGGIAGGSYLISTLADLLRFEKHGVLTRAGRYLSFVCILASPVLLILDLGRPLRFHHMLRVLKFRSVMSLGTWGLTAFGLCSGLTTAYQAASDGLLNWFPLLARWMKAVPIKLVEVLGSLLGLFVASYTGVLLSSTAVPVWARARRLLGPLFLSSALSTALASLSCLLSFGRNNQPLVEKLERAEMVSMSMELGLISALPRLLGSLGKPLFRGRTGILFKAGTIGAGLAFPLLARIIGKLGGKSTPRTVNIVLSLLVLAGGMILRYVWIVAGRLSAHDPEAVHTYNALEGKKR
ncbi:NrfD/PsrC family molybdoenzyme membrane anchor subunit [Ktedonobacter racemifer]|uniref:Polysulphide reductase NrfD n=1 Tax=Ktedonobacter racemifer DSM 44963 TaxID=485913 RepID=D6TS46_KTERA|nr:NrfD/PsrC family molybdoenzyme membrane anchor subunit [Ktedonobacter racemifer]EFH86119.1 Polysulphide reductase NrfD [Ktedonobacter racemifer DSM 44963]